MHWLSLPLVSCLILALSSCPAHSQSTSNKDNEAVVPLIYNDNYAPEVLDLLTQGILKYGIFNTDIKKHPKLQQRLDKTVKGLKLDLGVGILGNTVKVDLGLGQLKSKKEKKSKPRSLSTRHASNNNLQHSSRGLAASHETHHHKEKRLLGLEVGLTGLIGGGGTSDNDDSLISVELGLQTIVDDGWNDAVTTRLMNSGNDNAVSSLFIQSDQGYM